MYDHLNIVGDHPLIPEQAFLFVPYHQTAIEQKIKDDFKIGGGKKIRRLIFQGWGEKTYTQYERQKLQQFEEYLAKKKITLDQRWNKSWKLRFLLSTNCDIKKCIEDMKVFIDYQESIRNLQMSNIVSKYLNMGAFYVAGRDSHYRPILIFDVDKIIQSKMTEDELMEVQTYFLQYVMRNLLIPGQVQNWVAVIDTNFQGLMSLVGTMRKSFTFLSNTFRSRMFACYVMRSASSVYFLWNVVKKFLDEQTINKINIFDDLRVEPLLEYCNLSQLQERFGGKLPNFKNGQFWPPRIVSNSYQVEKEKTKILTKQQYTKYYKENIFFNTKFHELNIIKQNESKVKENENKNILKRIQKEFKIRMELSVQDHPTEYQRFVPSLPKNIDYQQKINALALNIKGVKDK